MVVRIVGMIWLAAPMEPAATVPVTAVEALARPTATPRVLDGNTTEVTPLASMPLYWVPALVATPDARLAALKPGWPMALTTEVGK